LRARNSSFAGVGSATKRRSGAAAAILSTIESSSSAEK
jgi:hypothetical protein